MSSGKKSFVLYFDSYPMIARLPPEQRGALLSALFEYALASAKAPCEFQQTLRNHPEMTGETGMAFAFLAENIRRDTEKWREKQARYTRAARERAERGSDSGLRQYTQALHAARESWAAELPSTAAR